MSGNDLANEELQSETDSERIEKPEQSESEEEQDNIIEILTKKKKRKTFSRFEVVEDDENMIDQLLADMKKAADDDIEANNNSLPALNKLKMLDKVLKFLKVSKYHDTFLIMNGCVVLGRWLSQLPDGSFPSTPLRKSLLEALQEIPVSVDNLQNSDLGKSVMAVYNNPRENVQIKKLAKTLVDKWSRMAFEINTEYTALHQPDQAVEEISLPKKKINLQSLINSEIQTSYTKVPVKGLFNFTKRPVSEASNDVTHQFSSESTYGKLKKKIMKKKRG